MYTVKVASIDEFRESKDTWNTLVLQMKFPSIFCTWEWIYTWWEHFGNKYELMILFVFRGSELHGILPLASRKVILNNDWSIGRVLTYCGSMELAPDYIDIISSQENALQCITAVYNFLSSEYKKWDMLHFSHMLEDNYFVTWLDTNVSNFDSRRIFVSVAPFISLSGSFNEFSNKLSSNFRKNLNKRRRKLFEQNNFKYISWEQSNITEGLSTLFHLHGKRAQDKNRVSTFNNENLFKFHRDLISRCNNNWVWLRCLGNDKKVIAASYCFVFKDRVFAYQKGFDSEWNHYGVGTLINFETIKEAFDKGYKEFNFLRGNEEHKKNWTQTMRVLLNVSIYNRTLKGLYSKKAVQLKDLIKSTLRKFMKQ